MIQFKFQIIAAAQPAPNVSNGWKADVTPESLSTKLGPLSRR